MCLSTVLSSSVNRMVMLGKRLSLSSALHASGIPAVEVLVLMGIYGSLFQSQKRKF